MTKLTEMDPSLNGKMLIVKTRNIKSLIDVEVSISSVGGRTFYHLHNKEKTYGCNLGIGDEDTLTALSKRGMTIHQQPVHELWK